MLSLGLSGGIAAGKSLLSSRFRELGATVIDADQLARDVVAPGTAGLAAVVHHFGDGVLLADGTLNRAALGALVFADKDELAVLNGIVHPLVRESAEAIKRDAGPGTVVVQDIPLLVETGQGANFHLVVVVSAPADVRLERMVSERGMSAEDALARMAAQADDVQRDAAADIVLSNTGDPETVIARLDALWHERLLPFAANLAAGVPARRDGPVVIVEPDPSWPAQAARLTARLARAAGELAVGIDHIGSTAVPGLAAKDVLDLQLRVRDFADAEALAGAIASAGFPAQAGQWWDTGHDFAGGSAGERWEKRFHTAADPGRPVNLHVRVDGSPGAVFAVAFRNWLRAEAGPRMHYEAFKRELAALHSADNSSSGYAEAKEPWFATVSPGLAEWADRTGS
ncbi:dephospho-CoA kinase [Arthrobacter sp.]|uniref:dephospho-CoA kinase n=1 Tax=Arthrobacter sp. TaxID=1667 RepID=UPI0026DF656E|nr:dephospho-CoA kinase [Arthrobacter sp.]MDO5752820.1 dephospho-CoA kinase [Arthrobacter sp.]